MKTAIIFSVLLAAGLLTISTSNMVMADTTPSPQGADHATEGNMASGATNPSSSTPQPTTSDTSKAKKLPECTDTTIGSCKDSGDISSTPSTPIVNPGCNGLPGGGGGPCGTPNPTPQPTSQPTPTPSAPSAPSAPVKCPNGYGLVEKTGECISLSSPPPPGSGIVICENGFINAYCSPLGSGSLQGSLSYSGNYTNYKSIPVKPQIHNSSSTLPLSPNGIVGGLIK